MNDIKLLKKLISKIDNSYIAANDAYWQGINQGLKVSKYILEEEIKQLENKSTCSEIPNN